MVEDLPAFLFPEQPPADDPYRCFWGGKTEEGSRPSCLARPGLQTCGLMSRSSTAPETPPVVIAPRPRCRAQLKALGDLAEFEWVSEATEILAARIKRLRGGLRP